ncbi:MAG: hypothetical protein JW885_02310 [Deltaproteobacteria bacterium]|nr:hypothetical protein [Candidatus Zymogenaceae bacterium]
MHPFRFIRFFTILLASVIWVGFGPVTHTLYTTPPVEPGEHATILVDSASDSYITSINDTKLGIGIRSMILEVPPGLCYIVPLYNDGSYHTDETGELVFPLEAGRTYLFGARKGEQINRGKLCDTCRSVIKIEIEFYLIDQETFEYIDPYPIGDVPIAVYEKEEDK